MKHLKYCLLTTIMLLMPTLMRASDDEQLPVAHIDTLAAQQALAQSVTALMTPQIVLVEDHTLSLWNRTADGNWEMAFATYCGYGRNGMSLNRHEGDKTTPIGAFPLTVAFGIADDPGAAMPYRKVTPNSYWSGEKQDYNTWVEVEPGSRRMRNSEHLITYTVPYQYCFAIGFNIDPMVVGKGSAIFLHCKGENGWSTAGCVSVEQPVMVELLRRCHVGTRIIIVPRLTYIDMLGL